MKTLDVITAMLLLGCCQGCHYFELNLGSGSPRRDAAVRPLRPQAGEDGFDGDTAVFVSAVAVDPSYDWRRDSICGLQDALVILYRNTQMLFSVSSGLAYEVSSDYDTHHIISGHLYTEYSGASETVIKCDGIETVRFAGREFLKGLVAEDGRIYTLGQRRDGEGFSFRENGTLVFSRDKGSIFGSFQDKSYGETGALYRAGGRICFCYCDDGQAYSVLDGKARPDGSASQFSRIEDMKTDGENVWMTGSGAGGAPYLSVNGETGNLEPGLFPHFNNMENARLLISGGDVAVGGWFENIVPSSSGTYCIDSKGTWHLLNRRPATVIRSGDTFRAVETADGYILSSEEEGVVEEERSCHNMGANCVTMDDGGCACFGITPRDSSARPFIRIGRSTKELDINGYISGISTICL